MKHFCSSNKMLITWVNICSNQGHRVCFILDGFDEYHRISNTFVEEMIEGKLPKAMVIIFSRPVGTLKLKQSQTKIRSQIKIFSLRKIKFMPTLTLTLKPSRMSLRVMVEVVN